MIDKLKNISQGIQFLRLPSIGIGLVCLISAIKIILTSKTQEGDIYIIPSIIGVLWAVSTLSFLLTFHSVPEKADDTFSFFGKLKRNILRGWFWMLGIVFFITSLAVVFSSYRIISIWFKEYGI